MEEDQFSKYDFSEYLNKEEESVDYYDDKRNQDIEN